MDTEVSEENFVRGVTKIFGFNVQRSRYAEGVPSDRRASFIGSYTHADIDTTQVFGFSGRRLSERKKCDSDSQNIHGTEKELRVSIFELGVTLCQRLARMRRQFAIISRRQETEDRRLDQLIMFEE
jgi:hypothetical protein